MRSRPEAVVQPAPPIVTPSQAPIAVAPPAPAVDPGIPSSALSALRQTTRHQPARRRPTRRALPTALAAAKPSSSEIAPILRCHGLDRDRSASGSPRPSADWDQAESVSADLVAFYAAIAETADEGLSSSLSSSRAYVAAAEEMLRSWSGSRRHRRRLADAGRLPPTSTLPPLTAP